MAQSAHDKQRASRERPLTKAEKREIEDAVWVTTHLGNTVDGYYDVMSKDDW